MQIIDLYTVPAEKLTHYQKTCLDFDTKTIISHILSGHKALIMEVEGLDEYQYAVMDQGMVMAILRFRPQLTDETYYSLGHLSLDFNPLYQATLSGKALKEALNQVKPLYYMKQMSLITLDDPWMHGLVLDMGGQLTASHTSIRGQTNRYVFSFENKNHPFKTQVCPRKETKRLIIRPLTIDDSPDLYETFSSSEAMIHFGMYPLINPHQAEDFIKSFHQGFEKGSAVRWAIEVKALKKVVGTIGFHGFNGHTRKAEIGYELNPAFQGQGYMTEAIRTILNLGFEDFDLHRIEGLTYPENLPSQAVMLKQGFTKEGLLRDYCFFRGKHQSVFIFSLLRSDWDPIKE